MTDWHAAFATHAPVIAGLMLGTLARFGLALDSGGTIVRRQVYSHLMMLGLVELIVAVAADAHQLAPLPRALAGGAGAMLATKLLTRFAKWGERWISRWLPLDPPQP